MKNKKSKIKNCFFDMKGMLSFLIVFLINEKPMSGNELSNELEKRRGLRPSPGTIYPVLKNLKENKLIEESDRKSDKKTIRYELTKKGKTELDKAQEIFCKTFAGCS